VEVGFVRERARRMKKGRLMRPKMVAEMLITGFGRGVNEGKSEEAMEASRRKGEQ
jgi:hypothetical protein